MRQAHSVQDLRVFYDRWSPCIFAYCDLFLGERGRSEEATIEAFSRYFERLRKLFVSIHDLPLDSLPMSLLRQAIIASRWRDAEQRVDDHDTVTLREVVAKLPGAERETFILHGPLQLELEDTAAATGRSLGETKRLWINSLHALRFTWLNKGSSRNVLTSFTELPPMAEGR